MKTEIFWVTSEHLPEDVVVTDSHFWFNFIQDGCFPLSQAIWPQTAPFTSSPSLTLWGGPPSSLPTGCTVFAISASPSYPWHWMSKASFIRAILHDSCHALCSLQEALGWIKIISNPGTAVLMRHLQHNHPNQIFGSASSDDMAPPATAEWPRSPALTENEEPIGGRKDPAWSVLP